MTNIGFIGSRGMVGSVLISRMQEENDFQNINPVFFSTSQIGQSVPKFKTLFQDANDLKTLSAMDIIVTCQGGEYTKEIHPRLREFGWQGYWIDSSSHLRMDNDSIIVLDPINKKAIEQGIRNGCKNYIGGNCTTSLMLLALAGLFQENLIEWVTTMTYQAASGAGAKIMLELLQQSQFVNSKISTSSDNILELDKQATKALLDPRLPIENIGAPLTNSLIPWIDQPVENGQTREEKKTFLETNKILQSKTTIPIDGICVRINALRCHSQALTIKLKKDLPINEIENIIAGAHEWVKVIPNNREDTIKQLTPAAISGTLNVAVGRIKKLRLGSEYLSLFTVGDQLLWGAAEPLRRTLKIIEHSALKN